MIPNSAFFSRTRSHVVKVEAVIDSQECAVCGDQKLFARIEVSLLPASILGFTEKVDHFGHFRRPPARSTTTASDLEIAFDQRRFVKVSAVIFSL